MYTLLFFCVFRVEINLIVFQLKYISPQPENNDDKFLNAKLFQFQKQPKTCVCGRTYRTNERKHQMLKNKIKMNKNCVSGHEDT